MEFIKKTKNDLNKTRKMPKERVKSVNKQLKPRFGFGETPGGEENDNNVG